MFSAMRGSIERDIRMNYSMWTSYYIELTPEEMVDEFQSAGWSNLELSTEHSAELLRRGDPVKTGTEFKKYAEEHGILFPQGHLWLGCDVAGDESDAQIDELKRWLDLYLALGIKAAVIHAGGSEMVKNGTDAAIVLERRAAAFRALSAYVRDTDLTICLENTVADAAYAPDLLAIIKAAGDKNLGICLDTGHLNISKGIQSGFIRTAGDYLRALHIADNEGESDQHLMPYGRGTVDWDDVMSGLSEVGYSGLFNMEIPGEIRAPLDVKRMKLGYAKQVAGYMLGKLA